MIYAKEFKLIFDLVAFLNKNSIKKEDIIKIGAKNNSIGEKTIPDFYYLVFHSKKDTFEEVRVNLTV